MNAEVLTVGDELLIGQVVNTNAAWIGEQLHQAGIEVVRMTTLGDDEDAIRAALDEAFRHATLVIVTGGLGPTHDDVTRQAVAACFGVPLVFDEAVYAQICDRFVQRGRTVPESNRAQALIPEGFTVLPNPVGTAPGLWYAEEAGGRRRLLAVLPGVPFEMRVLMEHEVLPRLRALDGRRVILHKTLLTTGIGESHLQEKLGDAVSLLGPDLRLAYLPGTSGVRLRLTARAADEPAARARLEQLEAVLRARIAPYLFGEDGDTLEGVVGALLRERGLTLAVAESCTGGYVCHRLTNVSGASGYVTGGIVAYSNRVKIEVLGVDPAVLDEHGAVSEVVARQMAAGVRTCLGTDVGVATTGIMGPTGGTPEKPVGTVWVGYAGAHGTDATLHRFAHDRRTNKALASTAALNLIRLHLIGQRRIRPEG
ncbi:MAG: CinA-like protein [Rhodothermaceae bacterium]|nr:MAG: CinA-like protein [Rhodothermaceae bacterium]